MRVVGIDPGACGGLALLERGRLLEARAMPSRIGKSGKRRIDASALASIVRAWVGELPLDCAYVELVGPMPRDGSAGSFWFGKAAGLAEGVLSGLAVRVELVAPAVWKRRLGVPADKRGARARATKLLKREDLWPRQKDDGLAEAGLIALYGYQHELAKIGGGIEW